MKLTPDFLVPELEPLVLLDCLVVLPLDDLLGVLPLIVTLPPVAPFISLVLVFVCVYI